MCQNLNIFCPRSTVASTFNPRQYLQSFEISKQISCVLRGIKRAILRKLVKISDCRVSSFLKTVPGCRVSRHSEQDKQCNQTMKPPREKNSPCFPIDQCSNNY